MSQIEGIIKEALIKECGNMFHDKVFIVENLPRKFLYHKTVKMVPRKDRDGNLDGTMVPNQGREMEETLLPGIEFSASGDGAFLFWSSVQESKERLKDIDSFIERAVPRDARIPKRVDYAQIVGDPKSNPIPYSQIPRVILDVPEFVSKTIVSSSVNAPSVVTQDVVFTSHDIPPLVDRGMSKKNKDEQSLRMKKYWEDKRAAQASTATGS